jgi:hypothetical protein
MIETKSSLRRSWYDYNWDWVLISLLALVILAGIVLWITYADHSQTAAIPTSLLQDRTPANPRFDAPIGVCPILLSLFSDQGQSLIVLEGAARHIVCTGKLNETCTGSCP